MTQAAILAASGSPGTTTGFKNKIINGNMVVNQYSLGTVTPTAPTYIIDRWQAYNNSGSGRYTIAQSSTAPTGFVNSLAITSTSAYSVSASNILVLRQAVEGYNMADLGWGTASAKTITISFQVYSSLTGTFGGTLSNGNSDYSYPFTYTISSANTWTSISVTIAGPTSGTWLTTNGVGINVWFHIGVGSTYTGTAGSWSANGYYGATGATNIVATNGATFYITGVQLEVGTTATNFDFRSYGTELQLCQRYFNKYFLTGGSGPSGFNDASTKALAFYNYPVTMRTTPTVGTTGTASDYLIRFTLNTANLNAVPSLETANEQQIRLACNVASGLTAGQGIALIGTNSTIYLSYSAEL